MVVSSFRMVEKRSFHLYYNKFQQPCKAIFPICQRMPLCNISNLFFTPKKRLCSPLIFSANLDSVPKKCYTELVFNIS